MTAGFFMNPVYEPSKQLVVRSIISTTANKSNN